MYEWDLFAIYLDQTMHSFSSLYLAEMYPNIPLQNQTQPFYVYYGHLFHVDHIYLSADIFKGIAVLMSLWQ